MWEGTDEPHSGHDLNFAARHRWPERRSRFFIFEVLRLGTAMSREWLGNEVGINGGFSEMSKDSPATFDFPLT